MSEENVVKEEAEREREKALSYFVLCPLGQQWLCLCHKKCDHHLPLSLPPSTPLHTTPSYSHAQLILTHDSS